MQTIEIRRHTMRAQGEQHLTQAGVTLARRVGETLGRFDRVITSTVPRAFETAIAMGYAVDEQWSEMSTFPTLANAEMQWPQPFARIAELVARGGAVAQFAQELARLVAALAASLPKDGRALIIAHGGIVEAAVFACAPYVDYRAWGDALGYCEGARLRFDGEKCVGAELVRVDSG